MEKNIEQERCGVIEYAHAFYKHEVNLATSVNGDKARFKKLHLSSI